MYVQSIFSTGPQVCMNTLERCASWSVPDVARPPPYLSTCQKEDTYSQETRVIRASLRRRRPCAYSHLKCESFEQLQTCSLSLSLSPPPPSVPPSRRKPGPITQAFPRPPLTVLRATLSMALFPPSLFMTPFPHHNRTRPLLSASQ